MDATRATTLEWEEQLARRAHELDILARSLELRVQSLDRREHEMM